MKIGFERLLYVASIIGALTSAILGSATAVSAQTASLVPPEPLNLFAPVYPAAKDAQTYDPVAMQSTIEEALVVVGFTVKADGTTADVKAIDGFYSQPFADSAVAAVKRWTYKPATENGMAVDWQNMRIFIPYVFLDLEGGAFPRFDNDYGTISKLLNTKDYAGAKAAIEASFQKRHIVLLYEFAMAKMALSQAELGLGHPQAALKAIQLATPVIDLPREKQNAQLGSAINTRMQLLSNAFLPKDQQKRALEMRFRLEASLGEYVYALETFARLNKLSPVPASDPIAQEADVIHKAFASGQPLAVSAALEDGEWHHRPRQNAFTITDLKGSLSSIGIDCTRRTAKLPYQPDVDWTIPPTWGDCDVTVTGTQPATFTFVEFASQPPGAAASH